MKANAAPEHLMKQKIMWKVTLVTSSMWMRPIPPQWWASIGTSRKASVSKALTRLKLSTSLVPDTPQAKKQTTTPPITLTKNPRKKTIRTTTTHPPVPMVLNIRPQESPLVPLEVVTCLPANRQLNLTTMKFVTTRTDMETRQSTDGAPPRPNRVSTIGTTTLVTVTLVDMLTPVMAIRLAWARWLRDTMADSD